MGAALVAGLSPDRLERQLTSLARRLPNSAGLLRGATLPASVRFVTGRDGAMTLCWQGADGTPAWLGRTTMPHARAEALVEAFAPGSGNVLLVGMGQGAEAALLLARLAPHQAVFVIEEDAARAALAICLHDFVADLERGRLLIFAGSAAWDDLHRFLLEQNGYLAPDRVLSWPHFSHSDVHEISTRLTAISQDVAGQRAARRAALNSVLEQVAPGQAGSSASQRDRLVIASGAPSAAAWETASRLGEGASAAGAEVVTFVYDRPDAVHPLAMEERLASWRPSEIILLDSLPIALPYRLPPVSLAIMPTHGQALVPDWLGQVPAGAMLIARSARQQTAAVEAGFPAARIVLCPPAAGVTAAQRGANPSGSSPSGDSTASRGIALLATSLSTSAAAAGLNLATHVKLYERAAALGAARVDTLKPADAESLLSRAERDLGFHLRSASVRGGLLERVARLLIPALVNEAYAAVVRSHEPQVACVAQGGVVPRAGLLVVLDPAESRVHAILDAMAMNACVAVRQYDDTADAALGDASGVTSQLIRFGSRAELAELLDRCQREPEAFAVRGAAAGAHVRAAHTWLHRFQSLGGP
ncbi:MAG: hypothetical protein HBSAPP02_14070 [Phycisphaerae bacterium]|nr:MAG: hypothetical protein HRU71_07760 [Planctomycetia bacterium]RIK71263.1 MAG: hypothetical protein DCC66_01350 [Planctomycetota bacterium]GJQ26375.1 MAG: hypothetical protein HBSAPP02_14070 [Phycisphaerae bacterium]